MSFLGASTKFLRINPFSSMARIWSTVTPWSHYWRRAPSPPFVRSSREDEIDVIKIIFYINNHCITLADLCVKNGETSSMLGFSDGNMGLSQRNTCSTTPQYPQQKVFVFRVWKEKVLWKRQGTIGKSSLLFSFSLLHPANDIFLLRKFLAHIRGR